MSELAVDEIEIDQKGIDVLSALVELDESATTRDVREYLGDMSKGVLHYRLEEYLVPQDLVETHLPESEPGEFPAKEITLTDRGEEFLEQKDADSPTDSNITRRVAQLEEQVDSLLEVNQELREENEELRDVVESETTGDGGGSDGELQAKIDQLESRVNSVETHPVISSDTAPAVIDAGFILGNTAKKLLEQEVGESTVEEKRTELENTLQEEGSLLSE